MEIKHFPYGVVQEFESKPSDSKVSLLVTWKHYLSGREKLSLLEDSCKGIVCRSNSTLSLLKPCLTKFTFQNRIPKIVNRLPTQIPNVEIKGVEVNPETHMRTRLL